MHVKVGLDGFSPGLTTSTLLNGCIRRADQTNQKASPYIALRLEERTTVSFAIREILLKIIAYPGSVTKIPGLCTRQRFALPHRRPAILSGECRRIFWMEAPAFLGVIATHCPRKRGGGRHAVVVDLGGVLESRGGFVPAGSSPQGIFALSISNSYGCHVSYQFHICLRLAGR